MNAAIKNCNNIIYDRFITVIIFLILTVCACDRNRIESFSYWNEPVTGMVFVQIPGGNFTMGNLEGDSLSSNEERKHEVIISKNFWLGQSEVTQEQWQKIMGREEFHPEKPSPFRNAHPKYPVVSISYSDIQLFIEKLNAISQKHHFRLPTEAEWEYACRAGTTTPFSMGWTLSDTLANYNAVFPSSYSVPGRHVGHPMPVGTYPPNPWGLYDMHGNVWEWVSDWHAEYSPDEVKDPTGTSHGRMKVIRGGSWHFGAENARSSTRRTHEPESWGFSIGFRLVCEIK